MTTMQLMSTRTMAGRLGVHPNTILRWVTAGKLHPHKTPGGHFRFTEDDLRAVIDHEHDD